MNLVLKGRLVGSGDRGGAYDVEWPERRQSFVDGVGEDTKLAMRPVESVEAQRRRGSVTVVLGTDGKDEEAMKESLDVKAKTPEGGW
jgi:hypothetical protein